MSERLEVSCILTLEIMFNQWLQEMLSKRIPVIRSLCEPARILVFSGSGSLGSVSWRVLGPGEVNAAMGRKSGEAEGCLHCQDSRRPREAAGLFLAPNILTQVGKPWWPPRLLGHVLPSSVGPSACLPTGLS